MTVANDLHANTVDFSYKSIPNTTTEIARQEHKISIKGLPGDHIFEIIRQRCIFYEIDLLECICRYMNAPPELVIDVGANIGNHTIFFAKILGASVISIEPSPRALKLLRANISLNHLSQNVCIIESAAGNHQTMVSLIEADASNIGMTRVVDQKSDSINHPTVSVRTITEIVSQTDKRISGNVSLIKIDVEGFEKPVIEGAIPVIEQFLPAIVVELETEQDLAWVKYLLADYGYITFRKLPTFTPTFFISAKEIKETIFREYSYRTWRSINRGKVHRLLNKVRGSLCV